MSTAEAPARVGELLRGLRREAGLTQEELADAAGLSVRAVRDVERGAVATPQKETVRRLADALGLVGPVRDGFEETARGRGVAVATRTLPRDIVSFTGRQTEFEKLVEAAAGAGGVIGIHAIDGMAGVGKTAFAVHVAHRLADQFPDGQIFLPLHGHTPGQESVDPEDALASLLLTVGVAAGQVPPGLQDRMALWRDRLAGQRMLLILDDAVSSEQVLPLLPGTGASLVLVTSRRHLSALDEATAVSLDTLPAGEAAGLLIALAGRRDLRADDLGVAEIIRLCGYLPLAIGMVARQLRHHPAWTAAGRAADLAAAVDRLELMATENLSVAAAFNLSYEDVDEGQQRLFRRLGLHPGPEADAYTAAALDATTPAEARRGLEALYDQNLLTEIAPGRYRMHDLIREHARALAVRDDSAEDRERAVDGLLDYYQHTAARAEALIAREPRPGSAVAPGAIPAGVPALSGREQALAWARAERAGLLACLDHAAGTGRHARVVALTAGLAELLRRDGPWAEALIRHQAAVEAAHRLGDRLGEANMLHDLGTVWRLTDQCEAAARAQEQALAIYRDLGDRLGEANTLHELGDVRRMTGWYPAAAQNLEQALGIYRDHGDRLGQANTLHDLGNVRRLTGEYPAAAQHLEQALGIYRDHGDRLGQANALIPLGDVRRLTGDYPAADQAMEQALGIYRELGDRLGQANALLFLGVVRRVTGEYPAAAKALEQALDVHRDLDNRYGLANTLNETGHLYRATSDLAQAEGCYRQALGLARVLAGAYVEAEALAGLGRCALAAGNAPQAATLLRQALEIFQRIGAAEADDVSRDLAALGEPGPPA
ncbi:Regulatory protein AfsR [Streptomyces sp. RB5]|uniref:Regulatory protein AfsR n=1 Tax=Streptomyces smaragdinus TaxID=2585196 RepID=A0A7K0C9U8_9ACTN|nr:helix-turn-helix transcriptional regulator [Streptomyces smaragdinus]MQY10230.1 Regulatory protein AfsR [Streptomyces smaragdinus]